MEERRLSKGVQSLITATFSLYISHQQHCSDLMDSCFADKRITIELLLLSLLILEFAHAQTIQNLFNYTRKLNIVITIIITIEFPVLLQEHTYTGTHTHTYCIALPNGQMSEETLNHFNSFQFNIYNRVKQRMKKKKKKERFDDRI